MVQHVGQQKRERLISYDIARAPDCVTESQRRLLSRKARAPGGRQLPCKRFELFGLSARSERLVEFKSDIEVILDNPLIAPGNENEMLDAGCARLINHVLNHRPVDNR
jgi:hypothetical protein